ncbi:hypothetical protein [Streptomyces globisporus]
MRQPGLAVGDVLQREVGGVAVEGFGDDEVRRDRPAKAWLFP